jgi:hypothetical protein
MFFFYKFYFTDGSFVIRGNIDNVLIVWGRNIAIIESLREILSI